MKKKETFFCLIMVLMLILQLAACGNEKDECRNVLDEFEYACNELDADAMLRCINPKIADPIRLGLSLLTHMTDKDIDDYVDEIAESLIETMDEVNIDATELFHSMKLEVTKVKAKGKKALAYVNITFETMGVEMEKYGVFQMIQVDDIWYIESFSFTENTYE